MPKSRRLRRTKRMRMRGGNEEMPNATEEMPNTTEEIPNATEEIPNATEEIPNATKEVSVPSTTISGNVQQPDIAKKVKDTATNALQSIKNLGSSFKNWLGFGGKKTRKTRKNRKTRKH